MIGIQSKDINKFWDDIKTAILDGNRKADFLKWYSLDDIKQRLLSAEWQCWVVDQTIFLTCITVYPTQYKEFEILLVCGDGMDKWDFESWYTLKAFAIHHKCNDIKFMGRKGWGRYGKEIEPDLSTEHRYRVKLWRAVD